MRRVIWFLFLSLILVTGSVSWAGSYEDFFIAIEKDNARLIESLLNQGFDPNTINPSGLPALSASIKAPAPKVVKILMAHPAIKIEARSPQDESPLMLASLVGDLELCKALIALNADVNKPGWTPLHYAATNAHTSVIEYLLEQFAYVDATSPNGTTPLMMAAMYGSDSAVQLLLQAGADPGLKNDQGLGALEFAQLVKKETSAAHIAAFIRDRRPKGVW